MSSYTLPASEPRSSLKSSSFIGYLLMSFLTAVTDNMYRWLIIPIAKDQLKGTGLSPEQFKAEESLILSLGLGSLILPFVIFAPWSSWLGDRFSKRTTTIWLKAAEVVLVALGIWSIQTGHQGTMFAVLFLLGTQSALLSTAKYGIISELVPRSSLSAANGLVALVTLIAAIVGAGAGMQLGEHAIASKSLTLAAVALEVVAVLGVIGSLMIQRVPSANPTLAFPWNPIQYSWRDMKLVFSDRPILRVTLGIAFFWSLASLAQMNIDTYVTGELHKTQTDVGTFLAVLSLGVGLGSVLAGWWSGGRVELGMVPLGAFLMSLACVILFLCHDSSLMAGAMLGMIGLGGGLFNVPLNAYLQERSPHEKLGAILAAGNQLTSLGMVAVAGLFWFLSGRLQLSAAQIFLLTGIGILPIFAYVVWLLPQATVRFFVWLLSRFVYRVRIYDVENLPEKGPGLLVANHVSWLDGILLLLSSSRNIRMVAYADYVKGPWIGWLARLFGIIPIRSGDGPRALLQSLNTAREALLAGELVCIFAEGQVTRNGQLQKFERGLLKILKGTDAPVIPVFLDELWGSIFSYDRGKFLWKKPRHWPYPVSISFGAPLPGVNDVDVVRHGVLELGAKSMERRKHRRLLPAKQFIRQCRVAWRRTKVADSAGTQLTGGRLLAGSLALYRLLTSTVLKPENNYVGLLLPPSVGGVLANAAVTLAGKVAVNLNYTLSEDVVNYCIKDAGVQQVLTSRRFMEKRPMNLNAELIYLEDLSQQISGLAKIKALLIARFVPLRMLSRRLGLERVKPDDVMSIIFTSGSTGDPKGVMLTNDNVASNIEAVRHLLHLRPTDSVLGVLPFFHSFGYTVSMWLPLCTEPSGVYHFNPLDASTVGKLIEKYKSTILLATPTFLRSYMKRCSVEQMSSLNMVIVGAEKMPDELRDSFREKYGFEPSEGYGTTELSPIAAVNIPASRLGSESFGQTSTKHGTAGRVIPGSVAAVFDLETNERLGTNKEGMLKIKGPNVMLGYLNHPQKTAELIQDGWYTTGDLGMIDEEGFIRITGRQSRFSKIGGEMVPHIRIEQEIARIIDDTPGNETRTGQASNGQTPNEDASGDAEIMCAVTAVPDSSKGERLVVLHKPMQKSAREIIDQLQLAGLPNLWIPSSNCFLEVTQIPLLGTGKLDLRAIKETAISLCEVK